MEYKLIDSKAVDVSTTGRKVKVVISEMGSVDLDDDIIDKGAFTKTISERGPKGSDLVWHLTDHYPSLKYAVGKFAELYVDNNQLIGVTDIPNTSWGSDVLELYKVGAINQHSIGFSTVRAEVSEDPDKPRIIKELKLYEGSACCWAAQPNTPTLDAGMKGEFKTESDQLIKDLKFLMTAFKSGKLSDQTYELFEIHVKQIEAKLKQLSANTSTQAAAIAAPAPDARKRAFAKHLQIASLTI